MSMRRNGREPSPADVPTSTVTAAAAQSGLREIMGRVASGERVFITRRGRPKVVMLSVADYEGLMVDDAVDLEALEREFDELYWRMQRPGQRATVTGLLEVSGTELGEAS